MPPRTNSTFSITNTSTQFTVNPSNLDAYLIDEGTYNEIRAIGITLKFALGISLIVGVLALWISPILTL